MSRWNAGLAFALTGMELDLPASSGPDLELLMQQLAEAGWSSARLAELKQERYAAELPWPFPVPAPLRAGCGFAQFQAALTRAEELLGIRVGELAATPTRPLTEAERRLLADLPPHWGTI